MLDTQRENEQSEFNAAVATLMRIDEIKKVLDHLSTKRNYDQQYLHVKVLYKELVPFFNDSDKLRHANRFLQIRNIHAKWANSVKRKLAKVPNIEYYLDDWEIELRELEQKYGLNLPKRKDARFALASR